MDYVTLADQMEQLLVSKGLAETYNGIAMKPYNFVSQPLATLGLRIGGINYNPLTRIKGTQWYIGKLFAIVNNDIQGASIIASQYIADVIDTLSEWFLSCAEGVRQVKGLSGNHKIYQDTTAVTALRQAVNIPDDVITTNWVCAIYITIDLEYI